MPKKLANAAKSNEPAEKNATVLQHHDLPTKDPHSGMQSKVSHPEHQETSKKLEENKHITAGSEKTTSHHIEATHDINHQIHEHEEHKMSDIERAEHRDAGIEGNNNIENALNITGGISLPSNPEEAAENYVENLIERSEANMVQP